MDRLYTTTALLGVLGMIERPNAWLRDRYFSIPIQFDTKEIAFDKLKRRRKLAPFVSPKVPGKPRAHRGRQIMTFEPAYVKPKHEVDPDEGFVRIPGEMLGGELTAEDRYNLAVIQLLQDQDDEITRREEWMVAEILRTGAVTVEGEDYPAVTVDFGRDASLTKQLTTTARWGEADVRPLANLRSWAAEGANLGGGAMTEVILGAGASEILISDEEVRAILDNRRQLTGTFELGGAVTGAPGNEGAYLGSIGQFNFWQYTNKYEDDAGNVQDFWPEYGVGLISPGAHQGMMTHGAIRDKKAGLRPLPRFPKMWENEDPAVEFLMTQSAPLPVPGEPNATAFVAVR